MAEFSNINSYLNNATGFGLSLFLKGKSPLDVRSVVNTKEQLTEFKTFFNTADGKNPYYYPGMIVGCLEDGKVYILKSETEGFIEVGKETDVQAELGDGSSEKPHLVWTVDETTNEGKWEAGKIETTSVTKNEVSETNDVENYTIADSDASVNVYSKETVDIMFGWGTIEITENEQQQ